MGNTKCICINYRANAEKTLHIELIKTKLPMTEELWDTQCKPQGISGHNLLVSLIGYHIEMTMEKREVCNTRGLTDRERHTQILILKTYKGSKGKHSVQFDLTQKNGLAHAVANFGNLFCNGESQTLNSNIQN